MISEEKGQCIYRQEAIEAFQIFREYESNRSSGEWVDRIETVLNQLPSVTPQEPTDKSNLEKVCEELSAENDDLRDQLAMRDRFQKQEPCGDCISRRDAIKKFTYNYKGERIPDYDCDNWPIQIDLITVREYLRDLPPVTPQPQTGHWIYTPIIRLVDETDDGGKYITDYKCSCSKCGGDFGFQKMNDAFCKYCGAKMEVAEENG